MKKIIHIVTGIMIMMSLNSNVLAQGGAINNTPGAGSNVLGWDGTVGTGVQDITLENQFANKNVTFNTNNTGTNGSSTTKMTILGNSGSTSGYVGIGNFTPAYKLDVDAGDINLNTSSKAYRIGGDRILWHGGTINDIFVGVGAGNSTMLPGC